MRIFNILSSIVGLVVAWALSTMTTGDIHYESDGHAVTVTLSYTVEKDDLVVVSNWLGIALNDGDSGAEIALDIGQTERQFTVPSDLAVTIGAIVYIEVADVTGHKPDDTAYGLTAGAGKVAFFKATTNQDGTLVKGIIIPGNLAS